MVEERVDDNRNEEEGVNVANELAYVSWHLTNATPYTGELVSFSIVFKHCPVDVSHNRLIY